MTDPAHTPSREPDARVVSLAGPPERRADRRRRSVGWRSGDIVRAAALIIAFYVLLQLLWFATDLVLLTFLGVLFGLAVSAGVDHLQRLRIPRGVGAVLIVLSFFIVLYSIGAIVAPTIGGQVRELRVRLPEAVERVEGWINQRPGLIASLLGTGDSTAAAARV